MPKLPKPPITAKQEAQLRSVELPGKFADHLRAIALGDKPLPDAPGERHHYVPQMLLRRFHAPRSREVFQLDKTDGTCTGVKPKDAAWEPYFYAVESVDGDADGLIEALLALGENYAAQALDRFLAHPEELTEDDRLDLAFFVGMQEQRGPGFLTELKARMEESATMHAAVRLTNVRDSTKHQRQAQELRDDLTAGRVYLEMPMNNVLKMMLETFAPIAFIVRDMPWTLLTTTGDDRFVCSDWPVTKHDAAPSHSWSAAAWLSSPTVRTTFPLSSKACLRISPGDRDHLAGRNTKRQVRSINLRTYGWATRYVYGPSAEALTELHEFALANPDDVPRRTPHRHVILEDLETADPAVADRNEARGRPRTLAVRQRDGSFRAMSYEVIDSIDDARRAIGPRAPLSSDEA